MTSTIPHNIDQSVVRITSSNPGERSFGSGFVVYSDKDALYIVTCTHVLRDVGGASAVQVDGMHATVIASDSEDDSDLTVLRVAGLGDKPPLLLRPTFVAGSEIRLVGFAEYGNRYAIIPLNGQLDREVQLETSDRQQRITAWTLNVDDVFTIQGGYSGSPVVDSNSNTVCAVATHRKGKGESGLAISVSALARFWTECPPLHPVGKIETTKTKVYWGLAPDVEHFYGRESELDTLKQWIIDDRCRIVAIVGIGGVGKTHLSAKLGRGGIGKTDLTRKFSQDTYGHFQYIVWESLLDPKLFAEFVGETVEKLSDNSDFNIPKTVGDQIEKLLDYLRRKRCLIVLDNVETILQGGAMSRGYQEGFEAYGELLQRLGETPHKSCILITSREIPPEVARMRSHKKSVRLMELGGVDIATTKSIFADSGEFEASEQEWKDLNAFYNGNPLAIELAAKHIEEAYFGDISDFLHRGDQIFQGLRELLDWHYDRLSENEQEIFLWFATNREPTSPNDLGNDLVTRVGNEGFRSTIQSLRQKIPIETVERKFKLQPVLIEYATSKLIDQFSEEILSGKVELFNRHLVFKATSMDYVRTSQSRQLVAPLIKRLVSSLGWVKIEAQFRHILQNLREQKQSRSNGGYAGGNIVNLLIHGKRHLLDFDFSGIHIWQSFLQGVSLQGVNFAYSDIRMAVFTEAFGRVVGVAFSPDGKMLASGMATGDVIVWRRPDIAEIFLCKGHTNWVQSVAFSPDSRILASGGDDHKIRLWDMETGECIRLIEGHKYWVSEVKFSPDGKYLASASDDHTVALWDVNTGQCISIVSDHADRVRTVAFSPDGSSLASGGDDNKVRFWKTPSMEVAGILEGHEDSIQCIDVSLDGQYLVSGSEDKTVRIWDLQKQQVKYVLSGHTERVWHVVFSKTGNEVVSASHDNTIRLWDVAEGMCKFTLQGHTNEIWSVDIDPDDQIIASGSLDQTLRLWSLDTGESIKTLQGYINSIWATAFAPNNTVFASGGTDRLVYLWDVESGKCIRTIEGHTGTVMDIVFTPDSATVLSVGHDRIVRIWDVNTGKSLGTLEGHKRLIYAVDVHPDGTLVVTSSADETVRIWDLHNRKLIRTLSEHKDVIPWVTFSPDGQLIASCSEDKTVCIWETQTGKRLHVLSGHEGPIWSVAFSPDQRKLISGSTDRTIRIWDVQAGTQIGEPLTGHTNLINSVAFHPSGDIFASAAGTGDQVVRLWDNETVQTIAISPKEHGSQINSISFSFDGLIVASGSEDETARFWDGFTVQPLKTLRNERIYERMDITGVTGLTDLQRATLKRLGAIDDSQ